jgi:hypothetical protein
VPSHALHRVRSARFLWVCHRGGSANRRKRGRCSNHGRRRHDQKSGSEILATGFSASSIAPMLGAGAAGYLSGRACFRPKRSSGSRRRHIGRASRRIRATRRETPAAQELRQLGCSGLVKLTLSWASRVSAKSKTELRLLALTPHESAADRPA